MNWMIIVMFIAIGVSILNIVLTTMVLFHCDKQIDKNTRNISKCLKGQHDLANTVQEKTKNLFKDVDTLEHTVYDYMDKEGREELHSRVSLLEELVETFMKKQDDLESSLENLRFGHHALTEQLNHQWYQLEEYFRKTGVIKDEPGTEDNTRPV